MVCSTKSVAAMRTRQGILQVTVNLPPALLRPSNDPAESFAVAPDKAAPLWSCTVTVTEVCALRLAVTSPIDTRARAPIFVLNWNHLIGLVLIGLMQVVHQL